jgi:hypothetical protein
LVHELNVALKELRETLGWLRFVVKAELLPEKQMASHVDEAEQLCRILGKSVLTATGASTSPSADAQCPMPDARSHSATTSPNHQSPSSGHGSNPSQLLAEL